MTHSRSAWIAAINLSLTFAIILLQSWIADGIKGEALFPWWPGGTLKPGGSDFFWCVTGMGLLSIVFAGFLYRRRRSFLPVQIQRIGQAGRVVPHALLVLTVSRPQWQWQPDQLKRVVESRVESRALPATLPEALAAMAALGEREKFPWEQLLRAIQQHVPRLERLILIGSAGEKGTAASFEACRRMIVHYFPALDQAIIEPRETSFEALDDLLAVYREIIANEAGRKSEIMIDVTGGTKVVSIAAAMVTLEHPEIEFQYVQTEGAKGVRPFNVVSGLAGGDAP
jgi:hypothetical protein